MDVYDEELLLLWRTLNKLNVHYIMIGGVAVNLHGFSRTTADIDIWLFDSLPNRKAFRKALAELELGDFDAIETMQFIPGWTYFHLNNGIQIDVMTALKGLENVAFNECLQLSSSATIYDVEVPFLHINHLLEAKRATSRPKDLIDIIELEKIKNLRNEHL